MADEAWLASEVVRLRRRQDILERAAQIAHSTVEVPDGADGVVDMAVPTALGRGVQAQWDAKAVDEKLDTARAELEQAQAELDDKLAEQKTDLEGANQRLNDAEGQIENAFLGIDEAITLADQAKSNMPNRVDDPDFSFGDKNWQGTGGRFRLDPDMLIIGMNEATTAFVAETATRYGSTGDAIAWGSGGSTYELRLTGIFIAGSLTVTFGTVFTPSLSTTVTITSQAQLAEPIRVTMPDSTPTMTIAVKLEMTTNGVDEAVALQSVSVADVTTITEVKATADAALVSANGKQNIYYDSGDPSGTAPDGSVWYKVDTSGTVIQQWQYVDGAWVERPVSSEAIANLDVGKLTAGGAVIAELVAQAIASATASFQRADIKNLFVTAGATINEAVIDKLWADVVVARMLVADKIISSEAIVDELVGKVITAVTINGGTINGVTMVAGEFTTEADFDPDTTTYGVYINSQKGMIANGTLGYKIGGTTYDVRAQSKTQAATSQFTIDAKKAHELAGDTSVTTAETSGALNALGLTLNNYAANVNNSVIEQQDVFLYNDRLEMRSVGSGDNNIPHGGAWLEPGMLRIDGGDGGRPGDSNKTFVHSDSVRFTSYEQDERRLDASVDNRLALVAPRIDLNAGNGVYVNNQPLVGTWQPLTLNSPYTGTAEWKREGNTITFRAVYDESLAAGTAIQVLTMPTGTRPTMRHPLSASGSNMFDVSGYADVDGIIRIRVGDRATVPYLYGLWDVV
ncbi:hypothetical protein [Paramicrobacterium chengjingii]|uniref:DNA-binding protein n=1 Tax=Paramicrobacterium chengjingii TaxID=2769067 RepID=A0ABX6YLS6_9MICO|nr:hypothetical protein [Microbacterium chengjingii]QPZ39693.1 DNA-binding protein [Microbacterium chengjingii]